jgi:predicted MFS family arabinose efflux permease
MINRLNDGRVRTMRRLITVGYALISVGWFLLGGSPVLLVAALAIIVKAMGSSVYWTYSSVILQKTVPDQYLGRLFSLDMVGFQLGTVISTLVTGFAVEALGTGSVHRIVFVTGIASLVPLALWALSIPWIERQGAVEPVGEG